MTLVFGIGGLVNHLTTGSAWLNVVANKPVPAIALGGAHPVAHGTYDTALLHVSHLDSGAHGFAVTSEAAGTLVAASLWLLVAFLAWRLPHGRVLRKSLSTIVSIADVRFVLTVIAPVFEYGACLQKETEGLV